VTSPRLAVPPGACDCHVHVFPDAARYPRVPPFSAATHPVLPLAGYRRAQATLGTSRTVVVQPSAFGDDNAATLDAVAELGAASRSVGVFFDPARLTPAYLTALDSGGMRGVRVNLNRGLRDDLPAYVHALAARIAAAGWHLEILMRRQTLVDFAADLMRLPVPVVVAHFGLDEVVAVDDLAFAVVRGLLASGRGWVKLSAPYRLTGFGPPYDGLAPLAQALVNENPGQVLWGTDWPHPVLLGHTAWPDVLPDPALLLDALLDWGLAAATIDRVLVRPATCVG
jgi:predicted TIM-barrel fold metal-dependent hydrolase